MQELKIYANLVAPFDGIVTFRSGQSDPGTLITSGNTTATKELIRVSQIATIRIFVNVPQSYSTLIHAGETADLMVDEFPGRTFPAPSSRHDKFGRSRIAVAVGRVAGG